MAKAIVDMDGMGSGKPAKYLTDFGSPNSFPKPDRVFSYKGLEVEEYDLAWGENKRKLIWCIASITRLVVGGYSTMDDKPVRMNPLCHTDYDPRYSLSSKLEAREAVEKAFREYHKLQE